MKASGQRLFSIHFTVQLIMILIAIISIGLIWSIMVFMNMEIALSSTRETNELVAQNIERRLNELDRKLFTAIMNARDSSKNREIRLFEAVQPGTDVLRDQQFLSMSYRTLFFIDPMVEEILLVDGESWRKSSLIVASTYFSFPSQLDSSMIDLINNAIKFNKRFVTNGNSIYGIYRTTQSAKIQYVLISFSPNRLKAFLFPEEMNFDSLSIHEQGGGKVLGLVTSADNVVSVPIEQSEWILTTSVHPLPDSMTFFIIFPILISIMLYPYFNRRFDRGIHNLIADINAMKMVLPGSEKLPRIKNVDDISPIQTQLYRALVIFPLIPVIVTLIVSAALTIHHVTGLERDMTHTRALLTVHAIEQVERSIDSATASIILDQELQLLAKDAQHQVVTDRISGIINTSPHRRVWERSEGYSLHFSHDARDFSVQQGQVAEFFNFQGQQSETGAIALVSIEDDSLIYHRKIRSLDVGAMGRSVGFGLFAFHKSILREYLNQIPPSKNGIFQLETPFGSIGDAVPEGVRMAAERWPLAKSEYVLVSYLPLFDTFANVWLVIRPMLLLLCIIGILANTAVAIISRKFSIPLQDLSLQIASKNDLSPLFGNSRIKEVRLVIDAFNRLLSEIDLLVEENYRSKLKTAQEKALLRKTRLANLEQQINPHFVFNTLESLRLFALEKEVPELARYIASIGRLFRYAMKNEDLDSTLSQESDIALDYLLLQEFRYESTFRGQWEIPANAEEISCIRFLIQPIVENSFIHGYTQEQSDFRVDLKMQIDTDCVIVTVSDNGGKDIAHDSEHHMDSSIGLDNIRQRLTLRYNTDVSLEFFKHKDGIGATTRIVFPHQMPVLPTEIGIL